MATDCCGAGEQEVVERQSREGFADLVIPLHHRDHIIAQRCREDLRQQRGGAGGVLGGLEQRAVPRCGGGHQRREREVERIVPWRDDAHHP